MQSRTQTERSENTRAALLAAGRSLFAERGFRGTSTEEIVARAGVTRGALYHHFKGKEDLFFWVVDEIERQIGERVVAAGIGPGETWAGLIAGCEAYLDACTDPDVARIALIDAPAVLGWDKHRRMHEDYGVSIVTFGIEAAVAEGVIAQPVEPLVHMLLGALSEGAFLIAGSDDPHGTKEEVALTIRALMEGLRRDPGK